MAYIRQRGRSFEVTVKRHNRGWSATRRSITAARGWAEQAERDLDAGVNPYARYELGARGDTFGTWSERAVASRGVEPNTAAKDASHLRTHILPAWQHRPLEDISHLEVEVWVRKLEKTLAPATVHSVFHLFRAILTVAVRQHVLTENPAAYITLPPIPPGGEVFLTRAQVARLIAEVPEPYKVVVMFLAFTGARWSEMAGLERRRLDLERGRVLIVEVEPRHRRPGEPKGTKKAYPKGKKMRTLPLTPQLVEMLVGHLAESPAGPRDNVFRGPRGGTLSDSNFRNRVWNRQHTPKCRRDRTCTDRTCPPGALARAGLEETGASPHDLRHTYASWLAQDGVGMPEIAVRLGHRSTRTTEIYTHFAPEEFDRTLRALLNDDG